ADGSSAGGATPAWVEGDKLHVDLQKIAFDEQAKTLEVAASLSISNVKQGRTAKVDVTAAATHVDLPGLQSADAAVKHAAVRAIAWNHPLVSYEVDGQSFMNSCLGQVVLAGQKALLTNLKSGTAVGSVSWDGTLAQDLHVVAHGELKGVTVALAADNTVNDAGVRFDADGTLGVSSNLALDHVTVNKEQVALELGGHQFEVSSIQDLKFSGWQNGTFKDLVATAQQMKLVEIPADLVERINPLLKSLWKVQLYDTVTVTGRGNVQNQKGSFTVNWQIAPIDAAHSGLSAAARQPIAGQLMVGIDQVDSTHKQVSVDARASYGGEIFHVGMVSPPVEEPSDLLDAPATFMAGQAPSLHLPLAPLMERARRYLAGQPALLQACDAIDPAANPQLVLNTTVLDLNQQLGETGEMEAKWGFDLGLRNIQDRPVNGVTVLPKPTDFDVLGNVALAYAWKTNGDDRSLKSLRVVGCDLHLKNEYAALAYHLDTSDLVSTIGRVPATEVARAAGAAGPAEKARGASAAAAGATGAPKTPGKSAAAGASGASGSSKAQGAPTGANPPAEKLTLVKLPDAFHERVSLAVQREAYELARPVLRSWIQLRPLVAGQQAFTYSSTSDYVATGAKKEDSITFDCESQIEPFHAPATTGAGIAIGGGAGGAAGAAGVGSLKGLTGLTTKFQAEGVFGRLHFPYDAAAFNPLEFAFQTRGSLTVAFPIDVDQLVLFAHDNAVTLALDQNLLINTLNMPGSPINVGGTVFCRLNLTFDGKGDATGALEMNLDDLYAQIKNEGAMQELEVTSARAGIPLVLHEIRSAHPGSEPLTLDFGVTAHLAGDELTLRLADKNNRQVLGPLTLSEDATVIGRIAGRTLTLQKADATQETAVDFGQVGALAPLAQALHPAGQLHLKATATDVDLTKWLAPGKTVGTGGLGTAGAGAGADGAGGPPPMPVAPYLDPKFNPVTYQLFTAPDLTLHPSTAPKTQIALGIKNVTGDLRGAKTGEIDLAVNGLHPNQIRLTGFQVVAKPEAGSFLQALATWQLRASLKVSNEQPLYLTEMTGAIDPCLRSLGVPEPPSAPAQAPPPPAQAALAPGALDFIKPVTANLDVELGHLHYDRYEVDALTGSVLLDQGQLEMPDPPTATIYGGTAKVNILVRLTGPHPDIPKIQIDEDKLNYDDFLTRAFGSPGAAGGLMHVHIEGSGSNALDPTIDSLSFPTITMTSEKGVIKDITKFPCLGPLYSAAAAVFPNYLPARPGPIELGTQVLKNAKLEKGWLTYTEFPFKPTSGPLAGYEVVSTGRIHVADGTADYVTFEVTAVPAKVLDAVVDEACKSALEAANRQIPDAKYRLTAADIASAQALMREKAKQFLADGKLYVRGRGPLTHPKVEMTQPKAVADLLFQVGMEVAQKKIEAVLKKIAQEKIEQGLGDLLHPKKKK
ncbi:MAG: hypothetical protein ACREJ2_10405, partial [Planctomycetota bacterium]